MDELNVNPQPEGENPNQNADNPTENQPTSPPQQEGSFSLNQQARPEQGGVLETAPEEQPQGLSGQTNPAQMEPTPPQKTEEEESPGVLEQAQETEKKGLPKALLIGLGALAVVAVAGAAIYFTDSWPFRGQVSEVTPDGQDLQPAAQEYCQDGYYYPGSQQNDLILQQAGDQTLLQTNDNQQNLRLLNSIPAARAQTIDGTRNNTTASPTATADFQDLSQSDTADFQDIGQRADFGTLEMQELEQGALTDLNTNEQQDGVITATAETPERELATQQEGTFTATVPGGNEPLEVDVSSVEDSTGLTVNRQTFDPNDCVPIPTDCRTMNLLLGDPERYFISPEYAATLQAQYDEMCGETTTITQRDCGENASQDSNGDCVCDEGYFQVGEEEVQVPFAATVVTYTTPICEDCEGLNRRIEVLKTRLDRINSIQNPTDAQQAEKENLEGQIEDLEAIQAEQGCEPPEERTCEDVQAELNTLMNSPIPPTADQIAELESELDELGCEEPQECRENEVMNADGDCMCDEANGYFNIAQTPEDNPNIRAGARQCVNCDGLAARIDELKGMLANADTLDMTDEQRAAYVENLENEIDRLEAIQQERGCLPPPTDRTCDELLAEIAELENSPAAATPEVAAELATLKAQAARQQCVEEDPCAERIQEIHSLLAQGDTQGAYQKYLEYLASDCRDLDPCEEKLARATVARAFLSLVQDDPEQTQYFESEYVKARDEYYLDPLCSRDRCDEIENRDPTIETVERTPTRTVTLVDSGRTADSSTLTLATPTSDTSRLLTVTETQPQRLLSVSATETRELSVLSQQNLDAEITRRITEDDLLTDEEYYELYCRDPGDETDDETTLTVVKQVINDDGGQMAVGDFNLYIDQTPVTSGASNEVTVGSHVVSEDSVAGYTATISGDCDQNGNVTLAAGENKTCTITNNDTSEPGDEPGDEPDTPADIPGEPGVPPAAPTDEPVIISETVITPPTQTTTEQPTVEQPELHGGAPEQVPITESPEITKTGPEMFLFFFAFVASQAYYFRRKIYAAIQNRK